MSLPQKINPHSVPEELLRAAGRGDRVMLTLATLPRPTRLRVRLVGLTDEGFLVSASQKHRPTFDECLRCGTPVTLIYRGELRTISFVSRLHSRPDVATDSPDDTVLTIQRPVRYRTVQRRLGYRASVPQLGPVQFRFYTAEDGDTSTRLSGTQEIAIDVCDISVGGLGGTYSPDARSGQLLKVDDRLYVELNDGGDWQGLFARVETVLPGDDGRGSRVGINFEPLDRKQPGDRRVMAIVEQSVARLERLELQRLKDDV